MPKLFGKKISCLASALMVNERNLSNALSIFLSFILPGDVSDGGVSVADVNACQTS